MSRIDRKGDGERALSSTPATGATAETAVAEAREHVGNTVATPPLSPNLQKMLDETPWVILVAKSGGARVEPPNPDLENYLLEQAARACAKDPDLAQCARAYAYLYRGKPWADAVIQTARMNLRVEEEPPKTLH